MPIHAVYPGSFDPVTYGHLDIIRRASRIAGAEGRLTVAVLDNSEKRPLLTARERLDCLAGLTAGLGNVEIVSFSGLLTDFARENGVNLIIRGVRSAADYEYENVIAQVYRGLYDGAETVFLPADGRWAYLSSSVVREVAGRGGETGHMTPPEAAELLRKKTAEKIREGI